MSAYVIVEVEVTDPTGYEQYKPLVPNTVAAYGGRYLVRGGDMELVEGTRLPQRMVIIEFESCERAKAWLESPEYAPIRALRHRSTTSNMIVVEGIG